ncbi:MAG: hypothetical protein HY787_28325 [Deltaproteobacteria bacterium]|nr:hypothetical protein [Deltaproteobacteria bacterium]
MTPTVSFLCSSLQGKDLFPQSRLDKGLHLSRTDFTEPNQPLWTYRLYFRAIRKILSQDAYKTLKEAVRRQLCLPDKPIEIKEVLVYSEKHGNWYHPAKIEVITPQGCARFVLNVALTDRGQAVMSREIEAFTYLTGKYNYPWLPALYFYEESVRTPFPDKENQGLPLSLFLADWFEGFHEFHLSVDPLDGIIKPVLWDGSTKPNYLANLQARQLYRQISKILTLYYNPRTYEQIFPWHHGAGDFVVKVNGERTEVRLITVRQYGPLADPEEMSIEEALLFFFLNLSIRMRLDRVDGIGEIAWAGEDCLNSTWEGFLDGLWIKEKEGTLAPGFRNKFLKDLSRFSGVELNEKFLDLLASYSPEAPDLPVLRNNIISHIQQVHRIIKLGRNILL